MSNEELILTLPGKCLDVSNIVTAQRKFRNRGGIEGALKTMRKLEQEGLGKLVPNKKTKRAVKVS